MKSLQTRVVSVWDGAESNARFRPVASRACSFGPIFTAGSTCLHLDEVEFKSASELKQGSMLSPVSVGLIAEELASTGA